MTRNSRISERTIKLHAVKHAINITTIRSSADRRGKSGNSKKYHVQQLLSTFTWRFVDLRKEAVKKKLDISISTY